MDKVSIIVPVYNVENYIKKALDSLIAQTYKNIEIILVDDGSTDLSGKICDEYSKKDNRILVIHKKNGGVSSARNIGIDNSTGKFICFADPDDFVEKKYIESLYTLINQEENKNVFALCQYFRLEDNTIINPTISNKKYILTNEQYLARLLCEDELGGGVCWNKMFYADMIKKIKFDENISVGEDLKLVFKISKSIEKVCVTEEKLYNSVLRSGSLSKTYKEINLKKEESLCKSILNDIQNNYPSIYIYALKRYMVSLSYLLTYCDNSIKYKQEQKFGKKKLGKILISKTITMKEKVYLFSKIVFPKLYKMIRRLKYEKSLS